MDRPSGSAPSQPSQTSEGPQSGVVKMVWPPGATFARVYETEEGSPGTLRSSIKPVPRPPSGGFVTFTEEELIRTKIHQQEPELACHVKDARYPFAFDVLLTKWGNSVGYPQRSSDGTANVTPLPKQVYQLYFSASRLLARELEGPYHRTGFVPERFVFKYEHPHVSVEVVQSDEEAAAQLAIARGPEAVVGEGRLIDWNARLEEELSRPGDDSAQRSAGDQHL
ncbi:hypothetical protein A1Q1_07953 [Trichosporon asahii var. asahii CBS 2479]|uniref:Uncharacterized protein n=1 Tax=Trichosporon asahii var. asahii (strain ATCC 90039 / CBS 2479 / JCM 2466 / KCTC 7840 / NBRC 103889/ NCYC 2677 / UAMH 7654) TaxID=1186058 RepID=J5TH34_TRIAS|nr:hypothetical protein A1Q1_07953 [Trichosporon asahii var. asahii CBS 2479]EJT50891.1 hypothetical protein A1Q1_07953 [Trichosporon asahii var. asahii CBS 2479]